MGVIYGSRDNEFIAWYPCALKPVNEALWDPVHSTYYVHIPFCESICDYCGFSVAKHKGAAVDDYVDHLLLELQMYADAGRFACRSFEVGAFGGGTPSTLTSAQFLKIVRQLQRVLTVASGAEITLEANPLSLTQEKIETYKEAGVTRVSLGVQSFREALIN